MYVINARNVCQALPLGVAYLLNNGVREQSRAGPVIVAPGPVTTVTERPGERVLFSAVRDANPFFHLVESLWMLAGRNDAASLNRYVRDFGERFADDGALHGAYGHRWRAALGFDQLDYVVGVLRKDPTSRQCVLQMWDATPWHETGFGKGDCDLILLHGDDEIVLGSDDLRGTWKDRPCNTHVYLRVREGVLDLTVCCRSNDAVWGAHGANAVHFSVLQEYLAARIGVGVGRMIQVSNNYHVYESEVIRLRARHEASGSHYLLEDELLVDRYSTPKWPESLLLETAPMFNAPDAIDEDLCAFFEWHDGLPPGRSAWPEYSNLWFERTLHPMAVAAYIMHRKKDHVTALMCAREIEAPDWREACVEWIQRRAK